MGRPRRTANDNDQDEFTTPKTSKHNKDKPNSKVSELRKKLNALKIRVDHINAFLEKYPDVSEIPPSEIEVRLSIFDDMKPQWDEIIEGLVEFESEPYFLDLSTMCEEFSSTWYSLHAHLKQLQKPISDRKPNFSKPSIQNCVSLLPKLPEPKIPEFDGKLRGKAKDSIGFVSYTPDGYKEVWGNLCSENDDKRSIIDVHIKGLLDLPRVSKDNQKELSDLINLCNSHLSSLSAINYKIDKLSEMLLINIVLSKLNVNLRMDWEKEIPNNDVPTWNQLTDFLKKQNRILERTIDAKQPLSNNNNKTKKPSNNSRASNAQSNTFLSNATPDQSKSSNHSTSNSENSTSNSNKPTPKECPFCPKINHWLYECPNVLKLDSYGRYEKIKGLNFCANCLRHTNHNAKNCKAHGCKVCGKKHHSVLHHFYFKSSEAAPLQSSQPVAQNVDPIPSTSNNQNFHTQSKILTKKNILSTAIVLVRDHRGKYVECRALLDNASTSHYITESLASKLKLNRQPNSCSSLGINNTKSQISEKLITSVKSKTSSFQKELEFNIILSISDSLPQSSFDISLWDIPSNFSLADPQFNVGRPVEMLIGGEIFFDLLQAGKISVKGNQAQFQQTVFGWICVGSVLENAQVNYHCSTEQNSTQSDNLNQSLKHLFDIEQLPDKKFLSKEEQYCENYFLQTVTRDTQGRYQVSLPLKDNYMNLGESKQRAVKRFLNLERKFDTNSDFKKEYTDVIQDYLTQGHMKLVDNAKEDCKLSYYMPHHAVIKLSSSTTKVRVVFDASAKSSTNLSLNDVMYIGPTIQQSCFEIILRFRKHKFVFISDINKMYRQVKVESGQTPLQRIVWRDNKTDPLKTYELTTVTFGTAAAPYLATRALKQLAIDENQNFPNASEVVYKDFYVDDVLSGSDNLEDTIELQNELNNLIKRGGFKLHKWSSNNDQILNNVPVEDREILKSDDSSSDECLKALGLIWLPKSDQLKFHVPNIPINQSISKRTILSEIAKLYDPLGLLAPIIMTAKIFMQSLWKFHLDWDDHVPPDISNQWESYRSELEIARNIRLDRRILIDNPKIIQLHGFSDASEKGYGACLYVRSFDEDNNCLVKLVCSKTRVAPIKVLSLPRLELCGALLLSQLTKTVVNSIDIKFDTVYLWCDSTITLTWIQTPPHKLKTFIANRANEIQESTVNYVWNHIDTNLNPADCISRGVMPSELSNLRIWWEGPQFLTSNVVHLESNISSFTIDDTDNATFELKPNIVTLTAIEKLDQTEMLNFIERFSSFTKLLRVTAYCLRFSFNSSHPLSSRKVGELSVEEINTSLITLVKIVQKHAFHNEIKIIQNKKELSKTSSILSLSPFLDSDGVLRVGGRLNNSNLSFDVVHQILLPAKSHFSTLIFRQYHYANMHAGPQLLTSLVLQKFWPISARNQAKKCTRSYIACFKAKPKLVTQIMGDLPSERITPDLPFQKTGVDLCGPFVLKEKRVRNSKPYKIYVSIFVCFVTKSIHLELLSDLTTDCFIACLKRFIFRRKKPTFIWSDNATNFVGTRNKLKEWAHLFNEEMDFKKIKQFCTSEEITWQFIPPRSPNFGGLWESSVKSFKYHIKRITSNVTMSYEEFNTLAIQIEGILNSRPLSPISTDPCDPQPLTPAHFLTGGPITAPPEPSYEGTNQNRLSNWQLISQLTQRFWKRFSVEYLHNLQQRVKWKSVEPNLKTGDVVLIADDNLPTTQWLLGTVIEIHPGKDNRTRVSLIKTRAGNFLRAISKIAKLPIEQS